MEWMVCVKGDDSDLRELSNSLTSPELFLSKEENEYYLKSTSFDQLKDANEVRKKTEELLLFLNGAAKLALNTRESIKIDSVISIADDGKRKRTFFALGLVSTFQITSSVVINGIVQEVNQADPISNWYKLAQTDENVAKVLRLLANFGYDWVNLYRILEAIEEDVGGILRIIKKGWATKKAIRRFKHTADSVRAIGDFARHGRERTKPPKKPMTLSEAKSVVNNILHNWLRSKV